MDSYKYSFMETKAKYNWLRENERKKIINYLKRNGEKISYRGGTGIVNYTCGKKLERNYDLSNWKWVSFIKGNHKYFISLQAFDRDKNSKNFHVLFDRIGICQLNIGDKKPDYFSSMKITSLELPLTEADLKELHEIIRQMEQKV